MDDISTSALLIALGILIALSAYFSSSETGMMSINRYRLKHLQGEGHRGANRVQKLLDRPDRLIGLILIGNNLVNIAASAIATIICTRWFGETWAVFATTIGLTIILLIFAEVTPKTLNEKYQLEPHQIVDLKALKGDASDNIPGVKGIGEKTKLTINFMKTKMKEYEELKEELDKE